MTTILIRTLIIYLSLLLIMRFMGKRQLGELEISELVTALLLSEIASLPITNPDIPLSHALIPILVITSLEVLLSGLLMKIPFLKKILTVRPAILVRNGQPDRTTMENMRISTEELLSQLRQKDVTDPNDLAYAILEPNGQISVTLKSSARPATTQELGVETVETGIAHLVINDGQINRRNLSLAGKTDAWLQTLLRKKRLAAKDIFMLTVDDAGSVHIIPKGAA